MIATRSVSQEHTSIALDDDQFLIWLNASKGARQRTNYTSRRPFGLAAVRPKTLPLCKPTSHRPVSSCGAGQSHTQLGSLLPRVGGCRRAARADLFQRGVFACPRLETISLLSPHRSASWRPSLLPFLSVYSPMLPPSAASVLRVTVPWHRNRGGRTTMSASGSQTTKRVS